MMNQNLSQNRIFKVFFNGSTSQPTEDINITFVGLDSEDVFIPQFSEFLIKYNDMARKKEVFSFNNIKEVIALGNVDKAKYFQFYALFYTFKMDENNKQRAGILIGNHKEKGFLIVGFWPLNSIKVQAIKTENFVNLLNMIIKNTNQFEDLLLIA